MHPFKKHNEQKTQLPARSTQLGCILQPQDPFHMRNQRFIFGFLLAGAIASCSTPSGKTTNDAPFPEKTKALFGAEHLPGDKRPAEWMHTINRCAEGTDWQALEAQSLAALIRARRDGLRTEELADGNLSGEWFERGPLDIPGRVTDLHAFPEDDVLFALADHGIVFKGSMAGENWVALNDQFPLALDVAPVFDVFKTETGYRILCGGWIKVINQWGLFWSDDEGATWTQSGGYNPYPIMGIRRMFSRDEGGEAPTTYLFTHEYNPNQPIDYYSVFKSNDYGQNFELLYRSSIPVGDGWRHNKSDMWLDANLPDSPIFLALEDSLFEVSPVTGERQLKGFITENPNMTMCLLQGATTNDGTVLYAWAGIDGQGGTCWRSTESGSNWTFRNTIPYDWANYPFGQNSFGIAGDNAEEIALGGVLMSHSSDGGLTWTIPNTDPNGWYTLYHGDVPYTGTFELNGETKWIIGTDGGIYTEETGAGFAITPNGVEAFSLLFNNISRPGMNNTQIYKMATDLNAPERMFVGTQDNGYVMTNTGTDAEAAASFDYIWGGDVTALETGDGGASFWCWWLGDGTNYVTDPANSGVESTWSPYWVNGSIPYWEAPVHIKPSQPDVCITAGYIDNAGGSRLVRLQAVAGNDAQATQSDFNFAAASNGSLISAIASDPNDPNRLYVTTGNGRLFYSTNDGASWSQTNLGAPYFWCRHILVSALNPGEIWLGGSGYDNAAVFKSTDYGLTFEAVATGMPATIVERMAFNADESVVFAATGIAPFAYVTSTNQWYEIAGANAPLVHYMDVEYLEAQNTVRFATYARGVWDLRLDNEVTVNDQARARTIMYPNPASDLVFWNGLPDTAVRADAFNLSGQRFELPMITGASSTSVAHLARGVYLICLYTANGELMQTSKIIVGTP